MIQSAKILWRMQKIMAFISALLLISFLYLDYLKYNEVEQLKKLNTKYDKIIKRKLIHPLELQSRLLSVERHLRDHLKEKK